MGKERTGKPQVKEYDGFYIPRSFIVSRMLSSSVTTALGSPIGVYGTGQYGRCRYGVIFGIYGYDKYGECSYS